MNPLTGRRARAYVRDGIGYLGLAALEVPMGLLAAHTPLASNATFVAAASSVPPIAATILAARAESGRTAATWGKRREGLEVSAGGGAPTLTTALVRNAVKIGLPWMLGHLVVYRAIGGGFERGDALTIGATVSVYALGLTTVVLGASGQGRALHDRVAGTRVVSG